MGTHGPILTTADERQDVARVVVVANRTLGGQQLLEHARRRVSEGGATFHVLVPMTGDPNAGDQSVAESRLDAELERLRSLGATAEGVVVHQDPVAAVIEAVTAAPTTEVIVCTLPPGISRWIGADLPSRIRQGVDVPVTHIVAPAGLHDRIRSAGVRLTVFVGEGQTVGRAPLASEIVRRARDAGLAGATVLRGVEGFGASRAIHTTRLLSLSEDLPIVVILVDTQERIDAFLPVLDDLITKGLVVREDVEIVKYSAPSRG